MVMEEHSLVTSDKILTLPPGKYGARREKGTDVFFEVIPGKTVEVFGFTVVCKEDEHEKTE